MGVVVFVVWVVVVVCIVFLPVLQIIIYKTSYNSSPLSFDSAAKFKIKISVFNPSVLPPPLPHTCIHGVFQMTDKCEQCL